MSEEKNANDAFAIICNARDDDGQEKYNINYLALVDRRKNKSLFWTSDDSSLIMRFNNKSAAEKVVARLKYNSPKIVSYKQAVGIVNENNYNYEQFRDMEDCDAEYGFFDYKNS